MKQKRWTAAVLAAALVLALAGCDGASGPAADATLTPAPIETSTPPADGKSGGETDPAGAADGWGLTMDLTFRSSTVLEVTFTHSPEAGAEEAELTATPASEIRGLYQGESLAFGDYLRNVLQREWDDVEFLFDSAPVTIPWGGSVTLSCDLEATYGPLPPGTYVLCRPVTRTAEGGEPETRVYTARFGVVD